VNRPGVGPAAASGGSPCTVAKGRVVVEVGYRNEIDAGQGGTSILSSYPMAVIRMGIDKRNELLVVPPTMAVRSGVAGNVFLPAIGTQDSGLGWKHNFHARAAYQDALALTITTSTGTNGYSAGGPTFALDYVGALSLGPRVFASASFGAIDAPGTPLAGGPPQRFLSYQPSATVGYGLDARSVLFASDNVSFPLRPGGGSSNVLLLAAQRAISRSAVVDVETELNLRPQAGFSERTIGFGGAFYL
jgi:hypothetical protein